MMSSQPDLDRQRKSLLKPMTLSFYSKCEKGIINTVGHLASIPFSCVVPHPVVSHKCHNTPVACQDYFQVHLLSLALTLLRSNC